MIHIERIREFSHPNINKHREMRGYVHMGKNNRQVLNTSFVGHCPRCFIIVK